MGRAFPPSPETTLLTFSPTDVCGCNATPLGEGPPPSLPCFPAMSPPSKNIITHTFGPPWLWEVRLSTLRYLVDNL